MSELLPAHLLNGELGNVEEPRKVCFSYHSKLFDRVFGEGLRDKNSRIVHQQINSPKILDRDGDYLLRGLLKSNIAIKSVVFCRVIADPMLREFATTRYPFAISLFASARPIPRDAPVTTATLVATESLFAWFGLFDGSLPALFFITLSFSFRSFALNPLAHVRRATNQCDPLFLARTQESDL